MVGGGWWEVGGWVGGWMGGGGQGVRGTSLCNMPTPKGSADIYIYIYLGCGPHSHTYSSI